MFGDLFGSVRLAVAISRPPLVVPGSQRLITGLVQSTDPHLAYSPNGIGIVTLSLAGNVLPPPPITATFAGVLINPAPTFTSLGPVTVPPFPPLPSTFALAQNQAVTSAVASLAAPGQTVVYNGGAAINPRFLPLSEPSVFYDVFESYSLLTPARLIPQAPLVVLVPTPTAGGVVGRTKISDGNSPLPRDRVIFDYDFFDNVPLSARGVDVNRFSVGFEKTFLDGLASLEVRLPFASTLSSDVHADGGTTSDRVELGDLNLTLKALLLSGPVVNIAAGLGIDVPTANDTRLFGPAGNELLRVKNESVVLTPYLGYIVTPNDRLFVQNWVEFGFVANGNPVSVNPDGSGLQNVGRLTDQTLCQIDAQLGYWLVRSNDPSALVRGLAPFVELHYNATVGNPDELRTGALAIGAADAHVDELNLSAGLIALLGDRLQVVAGAVVPLKGHDDRSFDWQLGVHCNYVFGPVGGGWRPVEVAGF
jgi:hypothetical protein